MSSSCACSRYFWSTVRLKPDTTTVGSTVRLKPDTTTVGSTVRLKPDTTTVGSTVRLKPDTTTVGSTLCLLGDRLLCKVLDDRVDERWNSVLRRLDGRLDVVLGRGLGRDRSNRRDDRRPQEVRGRFGAHHLDEIADRRRARERHDVDAPIEQHPVDVGLALALRLGDGRAVGDHFR